MFVFVVHMIELPQPLLSLLERLQRLKSCHDRWCCLSKAWKPLIDSVIECRPVRKNGEIETFPISYPVGYNPDQTTIETTKEYSKKELLERYNYLGRTKLPRYSLIQLVTVMERLFNEIIKETLKEYPQKISNKRKIDSEVALGAN